MSTHTHCSFVSALPNATKIVVMTPVDFLHEVVPHSVFYGHNFIDEPESFTLCWKQNGFFREPLHGATLRSGYIASGYAMLEAERLLPRAVTWHHSTKRVHSERLHYVGSEMASSASRYMAPLYEVGT